MIQHYKQLINGSIEFEFLYQSMNKYYECAALHLSESLSKQSTKKSRDILKDQDSKP